MNDVWCQKFKRCKFVCSTSADFKLAIRCIVSLFACACIVCLSCFNGQKEQQSFSDAPILCNQCLYAISYCCRCRFWIISSFFLPLWVVITSQTGVKTVICRQKSRIVVLIFHMVSHFSKFKSYYKGKQSVA